MLPFHASQPRITEIYSDHDPCQAMFTPLWHHDMDFQYQMPMSPDKSWPAAPEMQSQQASYGMMASNNAAIIHPGAALPSISVVTEHLQPSPIDYTPNLSAITPLTPEMCLQGTPYAKTIAEAELEDHVMVSDHTETGDLFTAWTDAPFDQTLMKTPNITVDHIKSPASLQEPFQWQSPAPEYTTRRTSLSSSMSGPIFSPHGTPSIAAYRDDISNAGFSPSMAWTPRSMAESTFSGASPQSPSNGFFTRPGRAGYSRSRPFYASPSLGQRSNYQRGSSQTLPSRSMRPPIGQSHSDGLGVNYQAFANTYHGKPAQKRRRAISAITQRAEPLTVNSNTQQLRLPAYQLESFFASPSPEPLQGGFMEQVSSGSLSRAYACSSTLQHVASIYPPRGNASLDPLDGCQENAIPPPPSDFESEDNKPVRQTPLFEEDVYTPLWKRRDEAGNWEGWCHLCKPGVWLSMKTSRYWDDKKRNHGICANTKQRFPEPRDTRIVDLQGRLVDPANDNINIRDSNGNIADDAWIISELDGSLRKREGFCDNCQGWVHLDGPRSRAKGKMVGWWLHCYECLSQSKKS